MCPVLLVHLLDCHSGEMEVVEVGSHAELVPGRTLLGGIGQLAFDLVDDSVTLQELTQVDEVLVSTSVDSRISLKVDEVQVEVDYTRLEGNLELRDGIRMPIHCSFEVRTASISQLCINRAECLSRSISQAGSTHLFARSRYEWARNFLLSVLTNTTSASDREYGSS